jgi:hypothetical protein
MVSLEIFASVLTQDERCASPLLVIQSAPPRPWDLALFSQIKPQPKQQMRAAASLLMIETPSGLIINGQLVMELTVHPRS